MRPSDIRYSQDSISCYFDSKCPHSSYLLGETVDSVCAGRTSLSSIPTITVVYRSGHWYTADNRRLWVFRQLENMGKCEEIPVYVGYDIRDEKFTTTNGGLYVRVRGDPWGHRSLGTASWKSASQTRSTYWTESQTAPSYQYSAPAYSHRSRQNEAGVCTYCGYCCCCILVTVVLFTLLSIVASLK